MKEIVTTFLPVARARAMLDHVTQVEEDANSLAAKDVDGKPLTAKDADRAAAAEA